MNAAQVQQIISAHIEGASVAAVGADGKFEVTVVSDGFRDLDTVSRHRMVYAAISREIADGAIHALSIRAYTPEEAGSR